MIKIKTRPFRMAFAALVVAGLAGLAAPGGLDAAAPVMKPFVLVSDAPGDMKATVAQVKDKLSAAGFQVVGAYSPYPTATVIAVTSPALQKAAAATRFGAYAAAQRVSVTENAGKVQVAYTNPSYMASAYRLKGDLEDVRARFARALGGAGTEFGPKSGMNDEELRDYNYMFGMESFLDPIMLGRHDDHAAALKAVEANLAKGVKGITKVYRVDLPGGHETVFGVAMNGAKNGVKDQDDTFIMSEIDFKPLRSTAHLPYEIVVRDNEVYTLSARFRIAINFPDLAMMGPNSFMNIMGAPGAIKSALGAVAGGYKD